MYKSREFLSIHNVTVTLYRMGLEWWAGRICHAFQDSVAEDCRYNSVELAQGLPGTCDISMAAGIVNTICLNDEWKWITCCPRKILRQFRVIYKILGYTPRPTTNTAAHPVHLVCSLNLLLPLRTPACNAALLSPCIAYESAFLRRLRLSVTRILVCEFGEFISLLLYLLNLIPALRVLQHWVFSLQRSVCNQRVRVWLRTCEILVFCGGLAHLRFRVISFWGELSTHSSNGHWSANQQNCRFGGRDSRGVAQAGEAFQKPSEVVQ